MVEGAFAAELIVAGAHRAGVVLIETAVYLELMCALPALQRGRWSSFP